MRIRPFKRDEAKACVRLINKNKKDMGDLYTEKSFAKVASSNRYWVAEKKGKIVGLVGFSDLKNGIGMMVSLCVDPDFQGKGIGTELIRKIKSYAKRHSFRKVLLLTHAKNKKMMILAIKEDFIPEGSLRKHFRTGEDVVYFSYFLNSSGK